MTFGAKFHRHASIVKDIGRTEGEMKVFQRDPRINISRHLMTHLQPEDIDPGIMGFRCR